MIPPPAGNLIVTREDLYRLVWNEPMLKVAARFGVSSSYMARVCTVLNVPRPERGYWAKLAVGKVSPQPKLPEARPGDESVWRRGESLHSVPRSVPRPPNKKPGRRPKVPVSTADKHPLMVGANALFEAGRTSYSSKYLKPSKRLLVDLIVTKNGLNKALAFANQLFITLEANDHRVVIAPYSEQFGREAVDEHEVPRRNPGYNNLWSPQRPTVVYIGTVAVGLTIIEMSEEAEARYVNGDYVRLSEDTGKRRQRYAPTYSWTTKHEFPTGRLCLQAYSPYRRAKWIRQWRETKDRELTSQIPSIVRELAQSVEEIARLIEEGERQAAIELKRWEEQRREWERQEAKRRAAEAIKNSKEELLQIVKLWAHARRIDEFFKDAEAHLNHLEPEARQEMLDRLKRARNLVGSIDALERFRRWRSPKELMSAAEQDEHE